MASALFSPKETANAWIFADVISLINVLPITPIALFNGDMMHTAAYVTAIRLFARLSVSNLFDKMRYVLRI